MANMGSAKLFEKLGIILLFFFGLIIVFWPALSGQKIFNDNYVTSYAVGQTGYNFYKDFGNSLRQGHLQLWWSNYMAGFPVYLTQVGFFNLLGVFLFRFFDYILAYNWLIFFNFLFAGLAMYWFIRNLKLSQAAAILAGFAWMLSFNNIQYGSMPIFSNIYAFIPLFFCAILKISEGDKKYLFSGSLISAFGLLGGFTTIVFYTFTVGLSFALFLDLPKFFGKTLRGYIFIALIGVILASFWILPVLNYMQHTARGEAISSVSFYDYLKIGDVLRFFYPFIELPGFSGFTLLSGVANLYIGIVPLFLAIIAIWFWRKNKSTAFWLGLFIFAFSMRLWFFPFFQWTQFLPVFNRFRAPFHWYSLAFFSLATLSAYGFDIIQDTKNNIQNTKFYNIFIKAINWFAILNILIVITANLAVKFFRSNIFNIIFRYFDKHLYSASKKYPVDYYHRIITQVFNKSAVSFSIFNYQFLVSFIFILAGTLVFILYYKNHINFEKFKLFAVGITILNTTLIWQGYYDFIPKELITNPPDTIKFIKKLPDSKNFRVFRFYPPEMYNKFGLYNVKNPLDYDIKTLGLQINPYWIDGFGGGEPFRSRRISEVLDEIGYEIPATYNKPVWIKSDQLSLGDKISRFSSSRNINFLSTLNIKYVFSSFKLPNLKLIYETTATEKNIPVYVYENPKTMPRIYFAKSVRLVDSNDAFGELLKIKDFHEMTLVETNPKSYPKSEIVNTKQISNSKSEITIETFEPQLIKTKTQGGGWLVYSDANLPTWEAYIDGKKTQIHMANYLFKTVFVPQGKHEVIFKYPRLWEQDKYAFKNLFSK